jgi:hypothetical protein
MTSPEGFTREELSPLHLPEQAEHDGPRRPVLLQVDQQLSEGPRLRVPPELADALGAVEVGEAEDVEEFGSSRRREGRERYLRPIARISPRSGSRSVGRMLQNA